jgi:hypothetical protein
MKEQEYMPSIQLRRVANGWVVTPSMDYSRDSPTLDHTYVFADWKECADFMLMATVPTRAE